MWPVKGASVEGLKEFLYNRLDMTADFVENDMGNVVICRHVEKRPRYKDEVCVTFESKNIRDVVKAQGPNLAGCKEEAGMRLEIPDHLQKDFKSLMALAYDIKKTNPDLRRNVKFDEDNQGIYMDIQTKKEGAWRRVRPEQARTAGTRSRRRSGGPDDMDDDELRSLLGDDGETVDE